MTNPNSLASEIVELLEAVPALSTILTNGISYYQETESGLPRSVYQLVLDAALLAYIGYELTEDGGEVVQHTFSLYVRLSVGTFGAFVDAMLSGVPAGYDQAFCNLSLSNGERILLESASRATDDELNEYFEVRITVNDRNFA
jgi:hypothetical protein